MAASVQVRGIAELRAALAELGDGIERRVLSRASKKAAAQCLAVAKWLAPRGGGGKENSAGSKIGHMADSLKVVETKTKAGEIKQEIGSYTHSGLLHLVEFGTAPHDIQIPVGRGGRGFGNSGRLVQAYRTVKHPGSPAKPFLRPAIDNGGESAVAVFADEIEKGLKREATKASRAAAKARR